MGIVRGGADSGGNPPSAALAGSLALCHLQCSEIQALSSQANSLDDKTAPAEDDLVQNCSQVQSWSHLCVCVCVLHLLVRVQVGATYGVLTILLGLT